MPVVKVTIKWGKELIKNFEVNTDGSASDFKLSLYNKTGVPVDRMKITALKAWKGTLKDTESLTKVKDGMKMAMIGTSTGIPKASEENKVVFVEDMTIEDAAAIGAVIPAGLHNLGNTCYMNSTLQCLKMIPELREALSSYSPSGGYKEASLTKELGKLYKSLESKTDAITPMEFVQFLRSGWSLFAEQGGRGGYKQQDAEEFFQTVTQVLSSQLKSPTTSLPSLGLKDNIIDALFEVEFEETMSNTESPDEATTVKTTKARKLICNVGGGGGAAGEKILDITQGIKLGLSGDAEKYSEALGRNSIWNKQSKISKLPRYLCVQFMRFYWKATPESRDHAGVACKILKGVDFPLELDIYDHCTDSLKSKMKVFRDEETKKRFKDVIDDEKTEGEAGDSMEVEETLKMSMVEDSSELGVGIPVGFKGQYELFAAVTHKGRSSDSGHYIGWSLQNKEKDEWMCFDDNEVHPCKGEHIKELKGGGDYDMAYLLFYRYKQD